MLSSSISHNFGANAKVAYSLFDSLIDVILLQNTAFRRAHGMRANLTAGFGEPVLARRARLSRLADARATRRRPLEAIRAARVGYRDRYIKGVAEAAAGRLDLEALTRRPGDEARPELMRLPGVGPYTADLALIRAARRPDSLFLDVYTRELLSQLYFGGAHVSDEQLRGFAQTQRGRYQRYVGLHLTTDTDAWTKDLGVDLRLRSAALSDPDSPEEQAEPADPPVVASSVPTTSR